MYVAMHACFFSDYIYVYIPVCYWLVIININVKFNDYNFYTSLDEFDYYALTNSVTIPKDAVNFSLCIEIVDDGRFETNELLRVFAIPPVLPDGYVYSTADLIIFDDDGRLLILQRF